MNLLRSFLIFCSLFMAASVHAQWQTPNHSVPIGRGSGVIGYGSVPSGTVGQPLTSNGPNVDPSFQALQQFSPTLPGAVPPSGGGTSNFLRADGQWVSPVAQCTSAANVGFVGDGTTSNDIAFNNWWASLPAIGGCLEFGAGKYKFAAAIDKMMATARQTVTIRGLGTDLSVLYWPAGGGMKITQRISTDSIHVRDLTFSTGAANVGSGLYLSSGGVPLGSAQISDVTNVNFRGDDYDDIGANSFYWNIGLNVTGWSNIDIFALNFYGLVGAPGQPGGGIGIAYGGYGTVIAGIVNIYSSAFFFTAIGIELNSYWEGITIQQCNFNGETGGAGIYVPPAMTHTGPLLTINDSQFNTAGAQINLQTGVTQLALNGNTITTYGNSAIGATLGASISVTVIGNTFNLAAGAGTASLYMNGPYGIVLGNIFTSTATGVFLGASSSNVSVSQNRYIGVVTPVDNGGAGNSVGVVTQ